MLCAGCPQKFATFPGNPTTAPVSQGADDLDSSDPSTPSTNPATGPTPAAPIEQSILRPSPPPGPTVPLLHQSSLMLNPQTKLKKMMKMKMKRRQMKMKDQAVQAIFCPLLCHAL